MEHRTAVASNASATTKQQQQANETLVPHRAERIQGLEKIFVSAGLTVLKPTAVSAQLSFKEADVTYLADSQIDFVKSAITKFLQEFCPLVQEVLLPLALLLLLLYLRLYEFLNGKAVIIKH